MRRTKIDWADASWNPVTGCENGCEYCYARGITNRFAGDVRLNIAAQKVRQPIGNKGEKELYILEKPFLSDGGKMLSYPFGFAPTLHEYRLDNIDARKNGANVFVCSMADLFGDWIPDEWIERVFATCEQNLQHNYMFLTKNPERYIALAKADKLPQRANMWYGSTVTTEETMFFYAQGYNTFLSVEPILGEFSDQNGGFKADWVIVGAETGNRTGKVSPKKEWIQHIAKKCEEQGVPLFMKSSLDELMGDEIKREFPSQLGGEMPFSPQLEKKLMGDCLNCNERKKKADMHAVMLRKGRKKSAITVGYICDECLEKKNWMQEVFRNED